jgi:cysteine desulfurase/selenocysteine lyase
VNPAGVDGAARATLPGFDVVRVRREFPILQTRIRGLPLVYLDNAATSQKPRAVVQAEADFSLLANANVHRGVHTLSEQATQAYDQAREAVRDFVNAADAAEIVFTSGTTAAINLVAQSWARPRLRPGDEILLSVMEHHSNIVPWQLVAQASGAVLRVIPVTAAGELDLEEAGRLIGGRTRIVAVTHVSNVLGTVNPMARLAELAHAAGAVLLVDGAQAVPHLRVDVRALDCDFYAASAHKMYGPTGVGFLYGRRSLLDGMPPWQGGGGMIERVTFDQTSYAAPPARFEAGTPPIAQAIGLGAAVRWLQALDWSAMETHEAEVLAHAARRLAELPGVRVIGEPSHRAGVLSFVLDGIHPHDVGTVLDLRGVAVRAGHHCAQPLMNRFAVPATVRASFGLYNTLEEVEALVEGLVEARRVFA